jgi:non-specific serine/threonine protein kinase/serine/threonine-protein kinase
MNEDQTRVLAGTPGAGGNAPVPEGRIGSYRLVRLIGQGGMGEVWLAERADEAYSKQVAIKFMGSYQDREAADWFRRERQALARLEHPHIARLLDGGETPDGRLFLVMEYVDGVPIDQWCAGRAVEEIVDLFLQVCSAIEHAHRALIVHRDIKPANVLVTAEGQTRLLDFGIAKEMEETPTERAERTTTQAYTLHYASPEQLEGRNITVASDIYSLGALLYRLLSGRVPHAETNSALGQLQAIQTTQPPRPSRVVLADARLPELERRRRARRLHGDLDDIVLKCLRREPELRYGSARELIEDIGRYRAHEPVLARKGSAAYRASRFLRRHWLGLAAAAAVLLTLAGGLWATHRQALEAERQRALAQKRFDLSRALVNDVLFDFQDRLATVPGTIEARRRLVDQAQKYLHKVAADAQEDPGLLVDLALAERRLGDIAGNPGMPNLGDTPGALRHFQRADRLVRRALALQPGNIDAQNALAKIDFSLASYYYWNDDLAAAEKLFKQLIALLEAQARARPSAILDRDLGAAKVGLGDVYYWSSKLELALKTYDEGCAKILASKDTSTEWLDAKGNCHSRRSDALAWLERYPEAEAAIAAAIAIYKPMYEAKPDRLDRAHAYMVNLNKQGEIYSWQEKYPQSFAAYTESLRIAERQYNADPTDLRSARDLAMGRNKRGDAYVETKRFAEAIADYESAKAIFANLREKDPTQSEFERDFAISHHRIGIAYALSGQAAKATPYFDTELEIMRRRWQAAPTKAWARRDLAVALEDRVEAPATPAQVCAWRRENRDLLLALKADGAFTAADAEELAKNEEKLKACPPSG